MRYQNTVAGDIGDALGGAANTLAGLFVQAPQMALRQQQANAYGMQASKLAGDIAAQQKQREARERYGSGLAKLFQPQAQFADDGSSNMMMPMTGVDNFRANGASALPQLQADAFDAGVKPTDLAQMIRNNVVAGGGNDSDIAKAFLMTGHVIQPNDAFSLTGQQGVADRNQASEIAKIIATPREVSAGATMIPGALPANYSGPNFNGGRTVVGLPTESTAKGAAFGQLPPEQQTIAVGPSESQVNANTLQSLSPTDKRTAALGQAALADPQLQRGRARGAEIGKDEGALVGQWGKEADAATKMLGSIKNIEDRLANGASTGFGAEAKMQIGNALEGLGVSPQLTNQLFSTTDRAVIQKNSADMVIQAIGGSLGTGVSNADRDFIERVVPTLATPEQATKEILGYLRQRANGQIQKYKEGNDALNNGVNPLDFNAKWASDRGEQLNASQGSGQAKPAQAQATPGETKIVNGKPYAKINGQWFEQ